MLSFKRVASSGKSPLKHSDYEIASMKQPETKDNNIEHSIVAEARPNDEANVTVCVCVCNSYSEGPHKEAPLGLSAMSG